MTRQYSGRDTLIANLPYIIMVVLGAMILAVGFGGTPWAIGAAVGYLAYGVAGAFWIMIFMCPSCAYYGGRECPCGYGIIAAKLAKQREIRCFAKQFKKHIPVIVPLWLIPLAGGGILLRHAFSWPVLVLTLVFVLHSYVLLPLVAKSHGCAECPQRDDCPWMAIKRLVSSEPPRAS